MLKNIPLEFTGDLMKILMEMGHGDELVICDGNFPRFACPERIVTISGVDNVRMLKLILKYFPLNCGKVPPVTQMSVSEGNNYVPVIWEKYDEILNGCEEGTVTKQFLDRNEFYARARRAYAAVVTGEVHFYASLILTKGTVGNG